ncbi:cysteine rich repeat-containing protein [Kaistia geumhonensis]|uniref:Pyruvate/2-oxoglutarate dehydrogenase complex dihydrolipoamide acyltransferase (E2) component n=1 Tax=Kaistia geumhonensis TaxID=410839 RepID=A0ABU0M4Z0_9HYPH|nr:cysteine rich repeat-containing protein [Kaistia geumhonensis]MCX5478761.1 cysteine rich repeat-containing protein [Kaistia geumhonensis]MDQ0516020.1 pyruvate/2-oxoglutarate dehydrogenase complex dihydrolipoamide acyltransferase (E2) component [Kaistia geumhonensis]
MSIKRCFTPAARLGLVAMMLPLLAAGAAALTSSQQQALKSSCQSDYRAHCASVPPGGSEALQCLQSNLSALSTACQQAVKAASGGAAATAPAAAPAATPAPAAAPATATPAPAPTKPEAAATPPPPMPPLSPRQEAMIVRQYCGADFNRYCSTVRLGAGNGVACLRKNAARLSAGCKQALAAAMR